MKKQLFSLILSAFSTLLTAQTTITGTVVDTKNAPLMGASVTIEGTNTGVLTDSTGRFTLTVADEFKDAPLVFSHVGFGSKLEFMAKDNAPLIVKLGEGITLPEFVMSVTHVNHIIVCYGNSYSCFGVLSEIYAPTTTVDLTTETLIEEPKKELTINSLYANSASRQVDLSLISYKNQRALTTVVNMNGQVVFQQFTELLEGQNNVLLSAGQLATGLYILSVQQGKEQVTKKFVIAN